jgi:hypothetical protein
VLFLSGALQAQVVLVDFNKAGPAPTGNWNSIALTDQNLALVDSTGAATSIQVSHTFVTGLGVTSVPYVGGDAAWFDDVVVTDGWQIGGSSRQVSLSGFGSGVNVSFSVIAARGSGAAGATQTMSLVGASTVVIANSIEPYGTGMSTDGTSVNLFTGTVQPSAGTIQLLIAGSTAATINGLRFEVTPVPEPAAMGCAVATGALGFAMWRRFGARVCS